MIKIYAAPRSFFLFLLLCVCLTVPGYGQNTLGLLRHNSEQAASGYNLFYPHNQSTIFLVDNCGQLVHSWETDASRRPGNAVEILPNGNLVACTRNFDAPNDPIWAGGGGETVEIRSWDNEVLHSFTLNDDKYRLHHDIAPLPNGNILMITWVNKTREEAIAAGRDPAKLDRDELWSEAVLEWDPVADSIVWEWHVWDHLIQDFDPNKDNFGTVGGNPQLIDLNYDEHDGHPDWLHINALSYNPVLDQFALSVPYFNEIWVIDHSTTKEEAAGHSGGRSGMGGDLLYRWGNPATYRQGTANDQTLFFQHDIHWPFPKAQPGEPGYGMMAVFNNRVAPDRSTAHTFQPVVDPATGRYAFEGNILAPLDFTETRFHPEAPPQAVSDAVSSVQILENGNWLICAGRWGFTYELTPNDEIAWEYIVPIRAGSPATQGDTLERNNNMTFRVKRYPTDYAAFAGRDLTPRGYIEQEPNEGFCGLLVSTESLSPDISWQIFPNPAHEQLTVQHKALSGAQVLLVRDLQGRIVKEAMARGQQTMLPVGELAPGMYVIQLGAWARKVVVR